MSQPCCKLKGKIAIIAGGGSGIGRASTLLFSKEGAKIVVLDIDEKEGQNTVDLIDKEKGHGVFIQTDVTNGASIKNAVKRIINLYNKMDIFVNTTGIFKDGNIIETSEEDWNKIINVNLTGVFLCMKYFIPAMIKLGGGSIVNVSSEAGIVGIANQAAYNTSKSGVISLTKSAAVDFAQQNIRVNCICPGRCHTPLVQRIVDQSEHPEETLRILSEDRPLKRMGTPNEIAKGILFLASDDASYATGSILSVDGGYTVP